MGRPPLHRSSSRRRPGPITTEWLLLDEALPQVLIPLASRRRRVWVPTFTRTTAECLSAKILEFKFQTATPLRSRAAARVGLLVYLPPFEAGLSHMTEHCEEEGIVP